MEQSTVFREASLLYLLAELNEFSNLEKAWSDESSLCEEVAEGNR